MENDIRSAGRDNSGKFTKGNTAAKGNPYTKKAAEMRKALYSSVTAQDIQKIVNTLKAQAISGDLRAISLIFDRLLGQISTGIDLLERMEKLETLLQEQEEKEKRAED